MMSIIKFKDESSQLDFFDENKYKDKNDIISELIINTYIEIFDQDNKIPSTYSILNKIEYDMEARAYDITLGLNRHDLIEIRDETVMSVLSKNGCVFKWGACLCCDAQINIFEGLDDENYFELENKSMSK